MPTTRPVLPELPEGPGPSAPAADGVPQQLVDRYGRTVRDLRLSITDRCNLRCTYCMPAQGLQWLPTPDLLTTAELTRLGRLAVERLGVERIRLTGGEPLLRRDLEEVIASLATLRTTSGGKPDIALTTNGLGLEKRAVALRKAGLGRVNVSIDSLDPQDYAAITRRDRLADVLAGIAAADAAGLHPVKLNALQLRGINDDEAPDLLAFAMDHGYELRFIEQMPLDAGHTWRRDSMVTAAETMARLGEHFTLTPLPGRGAAPAERFLVDGGPATVGIIASVTAPFCGACDRLRLTADGQLRNCLFTTKESDLRTPMREGAGDEELAGIFHRCLLRKLPGHGINNPGFLQPKRPMNAIGG